MRIIDNNVKLIFSEPEFVFTTPKKTGKKTVTCILNWTPQWPTLHNLGIIERDGTPSPLTVCDLLPVHLQLREGRSIGVGAPLGDDTPDVEVGMRVARCKAETNAYNEFSSYLNTVMKSIASNATEVVGDFDKKRKKFAQINKEYLKKF